MNITLDSRILKVENLKLTDKPMDLIIDSIAVLLGNYHIERKRAAILILKILLKNKFLKCLFEDASLYPIERSDGRVAKWTKHIILKGYCEKCQSKDNLEAHHIIRWSDYPPGRIDLHNGICLCLKCHTEEHKGEKAYYMMKSKVDNINSKEVTLCQ